MAAKTDSKPAKTDGRRNNKGNVGNKGGGRKPRSDEKLLIERLDNIINKDDALRVLYELAIEDKDFRALQLYLAYRWGKPKERVDVTSNEESLSIPMINFVKK